MSWGIRGEVWQFLLGYQVWHQPTEVRETNRRARVEEYFRMKLQWKSMSEDYLPLDINITTEDPGVEALTNSAGSDEHWGIRAVVNHNTNNYSFSSPTTFLWVKNLVGRRSGCT